MFDALTDRFVKLQRKLRGYGALSQQEVGEALREVRTVLLEADVNYKVVGAFIRAVRQRLEEQDITRAVKPAEVIDVALFRELTNLLGGSPAKLELSGNPATVCLVGLQGTGKTTFAGKLAKLYKSRRPLLVACDPKRPAASEQLRRVAETAGAGFVPARDDVVANCLASLDVARRQGNNLVVFDTAGRLHIDNDLMAELELIQQQASPEATLLVLDGMVGQDALTQAEQFHERLKLTGACITKLDGDARGGAVVSVRQVTGLPVLFIGTGEKLADIEPFHPDRIASRILGRGDLHSLAEKVSATGNPEQQRATAEKFLKGRFDLEDFLDQLRNIKKMGSLSKLMKMIPGAGQVNVDETEMVRVEAMIQSMTPAERHDPDIIDGSRRRRIAEGSGTSVQDINRLLKEFGQARVMAKQLGGITPGRLPRGFTARRGR